MVISVVNQLVAVLQTCSLVKTVFGYIPSSVQTAQLPCAVVYQGGAEITQHTDDMRRQQREFRIVLAIDPEVQNTNKARVDAAYAVYEQVVNALTADWTLNNTVDHIAAIRDGGFGSVSIAGTAYAGYELTIEVVNKP